MALAGPSHVGKMPLPRVCCNSMVAFNRFRWPRARSRSSASFTKASCLLVSFSHRLAAGILLMLYRIGDSGGNSFRWVSARPGTLALTRERTAFSSWEMPLLQRVVDDGLPAWIPALGSWLLMHSYALLWCCGNLGIVSSICIRALHVQLLPTARN